MRSGEKSSSSGYGSREPIYTETSFKLTGDALNVLTRNAGYVRSIQVAARQEKLNRRNKSLTSSSGAGTLSTIPEGKVDFAVPSPVWPGEEQTYDSLVDEALLLYTSRNYVPDGAEEVRQIRELSVGEILADLLGKIQDAMDKKDEIRPEEVLRSLKENVTLSLEALRYSTEDEMRRLCVNLRNSKCVSSVVRAFGSSSTSGGNSCEGSPGSGSSSRERTTSTETEEIYEVPSGSSSSGFSDSFKQYEAGRLPSLPLEGVVAPVPNEYRNAFIYGTLCRTNLRLYSERFSKRDKGAQVPTLGKSLLGGGRNDCRPSVWQQYYGVKSSVPADPNYTPKPTDVPVYVSITYLCFFFFNLLFLVHRKDLPWAHPLLFFDIHPYPSRLHIQFSSADMYEGMT